MGHESPTPSPLDFEDIRRERNGRRQQNETRAKERLAGIGIDLPKSNRSLHVQDPLDNVTDRGPTAFNQTGFRSPTDQDEGLTQSGVPKQQPDPLDSLPGFGRGLVGFLRDIREGTVKNVPSVLKPVALPLVKAGQGVLAGMEWGGNVAETIAPYAVEKVQHFIPGRQELETKVAERQKSGQSRAEAIRSSWAETNLEAPFKIPFWKTAFTPNGSIQVDFQDVIEVGFDPIELALLFGTGGTSTGAGLLGAAARKTSIQSGLKTAVGQSLGVRGARSVGRTAATVPGFTAQELRTGFAGSREAIGSVPSAIREETGAVVDMVSGRAGEKRRADIVNYPIDQETIAKLIPLEEQMEQVFSKNWRWDNLVSKIPEAIRGTENTRRYKLILGVGENTYERIARLFDPSALVGNDDIAKSAVIWLNSTARLSSSLGNSVA